MVRKRQRDLRDFWPWYERHMEHGEGPAEPPPFYLSEISTPETISPVARRLAQGVTIAAAILVFVYIAWALFQ